MIFLIATAEMNTPHTYCTDAQYRTRYREYSQGVTAQDGTAWHGIGIEMRRKKVVMIHLKRHHQICRKGYASCCTV